MNSRQRVIIAYNAVADHDDPSTRDVLEQVAAVSAGLCGLGLDYETRAVHDGNVTTIAAEADGAVIFNLIEAPPGRPRQQVEVVEALQRLGIPFTGSGADAMWRSTDKVLTRSTLQAVGLAVAPGTVIDPSAPETFDGVPPPWILKPAWEDASVGLDGLLLCSSRAQAIARARELAARFGEQPILTEHFLPGRELNISLLADGVGVEVLPVAEIEYVDFPENEPRILGFAAKWDHGSFHYTHTVRRFLGPDEEALSLEVAEVARRSWAAIGVRGYARVDIRLDEQRRPCVLEVNANPCLSADAGFMAAAEQAGLTPSRVVERILAAATEETP